MLKLINIKKDYDVVDNKVEALKGITLNFRQNEFVSVLGPSGCGKTTLLNLIGGLDQATDGDLLIWDKSTKHFKDRDWDTYRNHRVGFVFQSYNLIPHQTVLGNVELALTIAGLDKETRIAKAKAALDKVGLSDQYYKKPNQLSGGQSQRVAIARALVNDPEILLADEPTGALDTKTSEQILDLIKEIASDRLVIMVTHNAVLAEKYSTRIINLLDGELISDSNPYTAQEAKQARAKAAENIKQIEAENNIQKEKAKMSFWTAFKLSVQNIFMKKKRTTLTAIAGSIGIIGVSLVLSISIGLQGFIDDMQNDMLAGNPIQIQQTAFDINAIGDFSMSEQKGIVEKGDYVNVGPMIEELNEQLSMRDNLMVENEITQDYIMYLNDMPEAYWSALHYDYGVDIGTSIYTSFAYPTYETGRETSLRGIITMYESLLETVDGFEQYASLIGTLNDPFAQAPDTRNTVTEEYVLSQYDVLYKKEGTNGIAKQANEVMIVLDKNRAIADLTLGHIGYYSQDNFVNLVNKAIGNEYDETLYDGGEINYSDLASMQYTWYPNDTIFKKQANAAIPFTYEPYALLDWSDGLNLNVVGIIEPKETLNYGMLSSGIYYTTALAEHITTENHNSVIANYLRNEEKNDAFMGTAIVLKKGAIIQEGMPPLPEDMIQVIDGKIIEYNFEYITAADAEKMFSKAIVNSGDMMQSIMGMFTDMGGVALVNYGLQELGANVASNITRDENGDIETWDVLYDEDGQAFGLPIEVSVYPPNFQQKDNALAWLDRWNSDETITLSNGKVIEKSAREQIVYMDMLSLIMSMISTLLTIITVALIGFTSLALIVSSVMIAIITYVSVVERIKEIGVIRSLGGRKKDVSNLFIAETFIIGTIAGLIGLGVTYLLSGLINLATGRLLGTNVAHFPWWVALIMLGVSVGLTLISGLIPSKSAAKKDPVVALRTE